MSEDKDRGITIKKEDDMPEWYEQVVLKGELADFSPVSGFMIIRPNGYSIWQKIQDEFNLTLKKYKVQNAYFPLLIPESFFKREAEHAEGFAPELAWVNRKSEDAEKLAIRPTSETIMYDAYSKWVRSWRDLPLRLNQWCNVLRWEVSDVKLFLRSREFLWQEGHCVYESEEECEKETLEILDEYQNLAKNILAIPSITGTKTEKEKFPGAKTTYTFESLMPDGKALQMGTSHNLGQGFAKSFEISYLDKNEKKAIPWQNSWGFSTRMLGAMVMMHADDKGLIIPPNAAENKVVIVPIVFKGKSDEPDKVAKKLESTLKEFNPILDDREEVTPGWKFNEWEMKGVPLRIEIGPRDVEKDQCVIVRRDTGKKEFVPLKDITKEINKTLETMQNDMFKKADKEMKDNIVEVSNFSEFEDAIKDKKMAKTLHCGETACETQIQEKTTATSRCIPFKETADGKCVHCSKPAKVVIYFSRNY
jgi:prolyl-tRNA synthetase